MRLNNLFILFLITLSLTTAVAANGLTEKGDNFDSDDTGITIKKIEDHLNENPANTLPGGFSNEEVKAYLKEELGRTIDPLPADGFRIDGDKLTTAKGGEMDIKSIPSDTNIKFQGGKVTIGNSQYDTSSNIRYENGEIISEPTETMEDPDTETSVSEGGTVKKSDQQISISSAQSVNSKDVQIKDTSNVIITDTTLSVQTANSLKFEETILNSITSFFMQRDDETQQAKSFHVQEAKSLNAGDSTFKDIINSDMTLSQDRIFNARIISAKDKNIFKLRSHTAFTSQFYEIRCDDGDEIRISEIAKGTQIKMPKGVEVKAGNIMFKALQENATLNITSSNDGATATYEIDGGNLSFRSKKDDELYSETLENAGTAKIDPEEGMFFITLTPELVINPAGRYSYKHEHHPERSFSLYNSGEEPYQVGFKKSGKHYEDYEKIAESENWGFVDIEANDHVLNSHIDFQKYGSVKKGEGIFQMFFQNIYKESDTSNKAVINSDEEDKIRINLSNDDPSKDIIAEIRHGFNSFFQKKSELFLDIRDQPAPYSLREFSFEEGVAPFFCNDKTCIMRNVRMHHPDRKNVEKTKILQAVEDQFEKELSMMNEVYKLQHMEFLKNHEDIR